MIKKIILCVIVCFVIFTGFQYFYPGCRKTVSSPSGFEIIAHRGIHVNWEKGTYDALTGCEAVHIYEPTHAYIENTIESIGAAFDMGATIVEIDIRSTSDGNLMVFHDWMLECRTNGMGKLADHPVSYLKTLDIGYGYTHDNGKTYPFRGKGVGKMPTLAEVLQAFPDRRFLIDHKDGSLETAELLVNILKTLPYSQPERLTYWGPEKSLAYIHKELPAIKRLICTRGQMKRWFKRYLLTFGLAGFPEESRGLVLGMPPKYRRLVWGWPYRFLNRVHDAGAKFYLMIDSEAEAKKFADFPCDGIITDYIEIVGKHFSLD